METSKEILRKIKSTIEGLDPAQKEVMLDILILIRDEGRKTLLVHAL